MTKTEIMRIIKDANTNNDIKWKVIKSEAKEIVQ